MASGTAIRFPSAGVCRKIWYNRAAARQTAQDLSKKSFVGVVKVCEVADWMQKA